MSDLVEKKPAKTVTASMYSSYQHSVAFNSKILGTTIVAKRKLKFLKLEWILSDAGRISVGNG